MNILTGRPRGRPPGSPNKRTAAIKAAVAQAADRLATEIPDAFVGDAHAFLMAIYKDPGHPIDLRLDAAKAAIRFEKPALAAVQVKEDRRSELHEFTTAELEAMIADTPEGQALLAAREPWKPKH